MACGGCGRPECRNVGRRVGRQRGRTGGRKERRDKEEGRKEGRKKGRYDDVGSGRRSDRLAVVGPAGHTL